MVSDLSIYNKIAVFFYLGRTTVRIGEYNFDSNPDCDTNGQEKQCANEPQDFAITKNDAIVHTGYDTTTFHNDIALIRLPKPANLSSDGAFPVCIPTTEAETSRIFKNFTVTGWGTTETGFPSPILLKVLAPRVEISDCAPIYAPRFVLTDNQLCAGGGEGQDLCAGSGGGPLMAEYTVDGAFRTMQYGITSFGPRLCGREGFPPVYTRVDKYVGWILDNIKP